MSKVDSLYQNAVDSMTPCEKIARSIDLLNWSRDFLWRQVQAENPGASDARIKLLVALRIYGGNTSMRSTIEGLLAHVPD